VIFIDMPGFTREDFEDVYSTAQMAHMGQIRRDGSEYFTHPSEVRNIVRKYYPSDYAAQMVALLHDSLEDAPGSTVGSIEEMESFIRGSISDPNSGHPTLG
jgi:(p)ppGpp synthase/HD superfamily hydrolase